MSKIELSTFLDYTSVSNLEISPNQDIISYVSSKMRYDKNDYNHTLHLRKDGKSYKALNLKQSDRYYWENDENILYFDEKNKEDKELKKNKHSILYRYNITTKKSSQAYIFPFPVSNITILKNSLLLQASLNMDEHAYFSDEETRTSFIKSDLAASEFEEITSVPFYSDGGTFTRNRSSQAFIFKDNQYTSLSKKDETIGHITVSDNKIYYTFAKNNGVPSFFADLRVFDLNSMTYQDLSNDNKYSFSKLFVLDNELYFLGSDKKEFGMNQNPDFYRVSTSIEKVLDFGLSTNNTSGSDVRFGTLVSSRTYNHHFYFTGTYHHHSVIYKFDGKNLEKYQVSQQSIDSFIIDNQSLYTIEITERTPQELYLDGKAITFFNRKVLKDKYIATPIHHSFENDGVTLDGWVLLPENFTLGKSYPSILNIHGGPKTIYSSIFYNEMQVWVNQGYVVYFTNPRGGDCYGDDFADIRGKYGTIDYEDIMAFTDLIQKEYQLDPERMGVTGGSYGGFMTNWIVSHTNRFKAAATQRSISNWTSFAGASDIGAYFAKDQTAADPVLDHDASWNQSPLKYVDDIKTPLLFIHSDKDYRCPIEQAMQLYSRVKTNGIDTKFIWFKNENHGLSRGGRPQSRLKRLTEITEWMNSYLK